MKINSSEYLLKHKPILKQVVKILSKDYPYVSILATDVTGTIYKTQMSETMVQDSSWCERGFVVRVHNGNHYSEFSFNEIPNTPDTQHTPQTDDQAKLIAGNIGDRIKNSLDAVNSFPFKKNQFPVVIEEPITKSVREKVQITPDDIEPGEMISRLSKLKSRAQNISPSLIDLRVIYEYSKVSKMFISESKDMDQTYIWSQGYLIPIVRKNDNTKYIYQSFSGLKGYELLDELENSLTKAVEEAEQLLNAHRVEPGEYDIICSPDVAGLIAHEAFGHGVEMDMFVKNRAKAVEYINKQVASELVTMHDGALAAREVSSYLFDDEGTLGTDTIVIDRGILKSGISDLLSAFQLKKIPTGNGKRESFENKAYARMTNTFFAPGNDTLEEMIVSIKRGYLLEKYSSGMEDPKNWGIQCMILYGREIIDGRLTGKLISPIIMTGYVPDVLKSVSMVSMDIELSGSGMCGKGYKEFVKTSSGGPYIKTRARLG